jgi:hypothetical protein
MTDYKHTDYINDFSLKHRSMRTGGIGRLQCLTYIPVLPGDLIEISMKSLFRLSALRRFLITDAVIDIFAFYQPYRHFYDQDFIDFIKDGRDETYTFPTYTTTSPQHYLPYIVNGNTIPQHLLGGYNRIWNEYFRLPSDTASILADNAQILEATDSEGRKSGRLIGRLKKPWTTPNQGTRATATDRQISVDETGGAGTHHIDLLDIEQVKAEYRLDLERDWETARYRDIIKRTWGGYANPDVDQRPTLLSRKSYPLSGYDIDGSSGSEFGSYTGKGLGDNTFYIPRKFIPEHGFIMLMATVRFPTMHIDETHPLLVNTNPNYLTLAGDPKLVAEEPPADLVTSDWLKGQTDFVAGEIPFGQFYRFQPDCLDQRMEELQGFPFLYGQYTSYEQIVYHQQTDYQNVFESNQLGNWQSQSLINCAVKRRYPTTRQSIYAGTR